MTNFCTRFFLLLLTVIFSFISFDCYAGPGTTFNKIVFFGDSLSDNGNLFGADYGYLPKSPPYFQGRFTNGYVWSEHAAKYFYDKDYISSTNFAVGGETAKFHNPVNGYLPYSLGASADSYWGRTLFRDRSHTLFVIWIGANDYLSGTDNVEELTSAVIGNIKAIIQNLISEGGMNFLIVNLPNISRTPYAINHNEIAKVFNDSITSHNKKLADVVSEISAGYKSVNIRLFDLNALFVDMLDNIRIYNDKYKMNISNTTSACWQGGYRLFRNAGNVVSDEEQIYQDLLAQRKLQYMRGVSAKKETPNSDSTVPHTMDDKQMAHYIATSPALFEAYSVTKKAENGTKPCKNPDNYIFWDQIHPTAVVHKVLGDYLIKYIEQNFQS